MTRDKVENLLDELKEEHSTEPERSSQETGGGVQEDSWDSGGSNGKDREWFEGKASEGDTEVYEDTGTSESISGTGSLTGGDSSSFLMVDEKLEKSPEWSKDFTINKSLPKSGKKVSSRERVDENGKREKLVLIVEDGEVTAHIFSKNR